MASMTGSASPAAQNGRTTSEDDHHVSPSDIAVGVVIGRTSEFFDFFVYGIASVLSVARTGAGDPNAGQTENLDAISAVVLGGTSLFGGRGTILGTFAGSLLIGTINNGLIIMGMDVSEQMMVSGGIIILAVAFGKKPTA